jgi:tetratricopeptide (TPR) repeat protein
LTLVESEPDQQPEPDEPVSPAVFDPRLIEQAATRLERLLSTREFDSQEDMDTFVAGLSPQQLLAPGKPRTRLDEAQEVIYQAWEADGAERERLARKALTISPDCSDAYLLLADEVAKSAEEAEVLYRQAVAAGERAIGPEQFENLTGMFWQTLETRPYMRAREGLASALAQTGKWAEALEHYFDMLRLNPNDNQGIRYVLLSGLLMLRLTDEARELIDEYPDDASAMWPYGRALAAFGTEGSTQSSGALLRSAISANQYVPSYLLGRRKLPATMPEYVGFGDESEGAYCAVELFAAWYSTPGALEWLARELKSSPSSTASQGERVPKAMRAHFDAITRITDEVCTRHLSDEYAELSRRLAAALCRKRPSPVTRGWTESWACGIVYALGSINFLFDKSSAPYLSAPDLCRLFGVATSTGANKASEIRDMFNMNDWLNGDWELPSIRDRNPLNVMLRSR